MNSDMALKALGQFKKIREYTLSLLKDVTEEKLLTIPAGFRNNILWNAGHIVSAQQGLVYTRSGLTPRVPEEWRVSFKKGTSPAEWMEPPDFSSVLLQLNETVSQLEADIQGGLFISYTPHTTSAGVPLESTEEALIFANYHEGLHQGVISALKKVV